MNVFNDTFCTEPINLNETINEIPGAEAVGLEVTMTVIYPK